MMQKVPIEPLQRAFLDSGLTLTEVCWRSGMIHGDKPNTSQLARKLGLRPESSRSKTNVNVMVSSAQTIADALGVDFDELYEDVVINGRPSRTKTPMCPSCGLETIVEAEMCGFCVEEMNSPIRA